MSGGLLSEVWAGYRPYLRQLAIDFLIAVTLWGLLAGFQWVTKLIEIREKAGEVISVIHSMGVVAVFGVLAASSVWDIVQLKRGKNA